MSTHRTAVYQPRSRRGQIAETVADGTRLRHRACHGEHSGGSSASALSCWRSPLVVALITYDPSDPSFNVATWRLPQQLDGRERRVRRRISVPDLRLGGVRASAAADGVGLRAFMGGAPPGGLIWRIGAVAGGAILISAGFGVSRSARISAGAGRRHRGPAFDRWRSPPAPNSSASRR